MLTAAILENQGRTAFIACANCRRGRTLDLSAMVAAGKGDLDIKSACETGRFRCGVCGFDRVTLHLERGGSRTERTA